MGRPSHSRTISVRTNDQRVGTWTFNRRVEHSLQYDSEWMNLLAEFGLPVAKTDILTFGSQKVLSVERFDRQMNSNGEWIMRLPQEDFCLPPHLKYESDGGPGLRDLASVLKGSLRAEQDLTNLLITQLLFWMLAAPDGHAKNFSIRVLPQGRYQLTPLNDVMSIWPVEGKRTNQFSRFRSKMAMAVLGKNRHYLFKDIQRPHFNDIAGKYFDRVDAEELIGRVLETVPIAIEVMQRKIPEGFPDWISESVFKGLRESTEFLKRVSKT